MRRDVSRNSCEVCRSLSHNNVSVLGRENQGLLLQLCEIVLASESSEITSDQVGEEGSHRQVELVIREVLVDRDLNLVEDGPEAAKTLLDDKVRQGSSKDG